mmetsp:Transcript_607/g.1887  ORF Transcript_607/g.1887 Transcript_607/m.1887 type:complete len:222 (-) Transcript_607:77-742(-)
MRRVPRRRPAAARRRVGLGAGDDGGALVGREEVREHVDRLRRLVEGRGIPDHGLDGVDGAVDDGALAVDVLRRERPQKVEARLRLVERDLGLLAGAAGQAGEAPQQRRRQRALGRRRRPQEEGAAPQRERAPVGRRLGSDGVDALGDVEQAHDVRRRRALGARARRQHGRDVHLDDARGLVDARALRAAAFVAPLRRRPRRGARLVQFGHFGVSGASSSVV